jgi:hypothetical protein
MLLGTEAYQHLVVARSDEQTARRRGHGKRIGVIDRPRVIYDNQSRPSFKRFAQSVLSFLLRGQRLLGSCQLAQKPVLKVKQVRLLADS